jgi:predicted secreted protein
LGDSFLDYFNQSQETIAIWVEDICQKYLIEDWVSWNYGDDENCPRIVHEPNPEPTLAIQDLALLIQQGAVKVDEDLEAYIRDRYMLPPPVPEEEEPEGPPTTLQPATVPGQLPPAPTPEQTAPAPAPPAPAPVPPQPAPKAGRAGHRRRRTVAAADGLSLLPLPNRTLRRQLYDQEVRAAVDYAQMDTDYNAAKNALVMEVSAQQTAQIQQIKEKILAAKNDLKKLAAIQADPIHSDIILARSIQMASTGAHQAINEAKRQGVTIHMPDMSSVASSLEARANATDALLARSISEAAGRKAIAFTNPKAMTPQAVADTVEEYLNGLSNTYLNDQLGGTLQQAMNAGRKEVFDSGADQPDQYYSSELLDDATCEACVGIDGTEYPDLLAAEADYPTGGYMDCLGGPRCRGTIIAVYGEAPTADGGDGE